MLSEAPLSKSRYLRWLQCPLRLYLDVHHRELATPPAASVQARFDVGHRVGALARARYPGGVLVEQGPHQHAEAVARTADLIRSGTRDIFEAAFTYDRVKIRADVLHALDGGGFELVEVKSTSRYDPAKHLPDVGIQAYVTLGAGLDVRRVTLMHLDTTYVWPGGPYDPERILAATDVTAEAFDYARSMAPHVAEMIAILEAAEPPSVQPSDSICRRPYECEFYAYCTRGIEPPDGLDVEPTVDAATAQRLEELRFPLLFVDFETVNPALPLFPSTSPFQVVKVQWSVHRLEADGALTHDEWLVASAETDPQPEFLSTLLDALGTSGTFVHYSPYELTQLVDLAARLPDMRDQLLATLPGLYDKVAQRLADRGEELPPRPDTGGGLASFDLGREAVARGVSHPALAGTWSIKAALPILAPSLPPYSSLAVTDGDAAMLATAEMLDPETPPERRAELRKALLRYCEQDTLAMVEIYRRMVSRASW
ncbi:MAG: DUF2779 domain-containing protein [Coriobacteriia bacterium]|nr:DUF2779 domain-containing protein [Coriobacteriia bacterium]